MIREMTAADVTAVAELEKNTFSDAWSAEVLCDELKKDYARYFVSERDGKIAGYAGIWCIYETAELVRIAAAEKRQGTGAALMAALTDAAEAAGCERIMLEVRADNAPAMAMYKKYGFSEISVRRGYYGGVDAIIMERSLAVLF